MSQLQPDQRVVAEGTLLYDGMVECDIRIVFGPICYGCGAFDEETELHEDVVRDTYYVEFGSTSERRAFNSSGGAYPTLEEAIVASAKTVGIGPTVRWYRVEAQQAVQGPTSPPSAGPRP